MTGRNLIPEGEVTPTEAEDARRISFASLLDGSGDELVHELVGSLPDSYRSDYRQGNTYRIMGVAVTAGRHHEPLASIVYNLGLTCLNKGFDAILVAYIHVLAVFYRKGFDNLIVLGSEDLTIDHKVCTGINRILIHCFINYWF